MVDALINDPQPHSRTASLRSSTQSGLGELRSPLETESFEDRGDRIFSTPISTIEDRGTRLLGQNDGQRALNCQDRAFFCTWMQHSCNWDRDQNIARFLEVTAANEAPTLKMPCEASHQKTPAEHKSNSLWYVGVILSIIGSICTNMGVNLQKYSFMCEAKRSVKSKRSYSRQPLWVIGLLLVVAGSLLDFVGLGFLPQSLATPVGGSTMVANVVFASLFLKEKFSRMDAIGTALVLIGICIVAAFANKESACYTVEELVTLYGEPVFVIYLVLVALSCFGLYTLAKKLERVLKNQGSSSPAYKKFARMHPVTYPALSGIFGAQSVLFAKSVAELVKTTLEGTNQFTNFGTYLICSSMFACIFLQIHWLANGLQFFDAVFVVPVFQCFFISTSIFGGGVYFKEFSSMSTLALAMFFFGASVTLSGVYLLSRREMNVLKPSAKLRAAVKMIIFIKRTQKARNIDHRWVQPAEKDHCSVGIPVSKPSTSATNPPRVTLPPVKISKASVMPIDGSHPPAPPIARTDVNASEATTALDLSSNSQIQITPKRFDK